MESAEEEESGGGMLISWGKEQQPALALGFWESRLTRGTRGLLCGMVCVCVEFNVKGTKLLFGWGKVGGFQGAEDASARGKNREYL